MKLDTLRIPNLNSLGGVNQLYGLKDLIDEYFTKSTYLCEIGTYCGISTALFAETCEEVVSIDKRFLPCLKEVLEQYTNIQFIHDTSENAVKNFEDMTFDAVYIDARHDYNYVKQDIELWLPKLKSGGIICGHDYITEKFLSFTGFDWHGKKMGYGGVKKAVDEKFKNVKVFKDSSWLVQL